MSEYETLAIADLERRSKNGGFVPHPVVDAVLDKVR